MPLGRTEELPEVVDAAYDVESPRKLVRIFATATRDEGAASEQCEGAGPETDRAEVPGLELTTGDCPERA